MNPFPAGEAAKRTSVTKEVYDRGTTATVSTLGSSGVLSLDTVIFVRLPAEDAT